MLALCRGPHSEVIPAGNEFFYWTVIPPDAMSDELALELVGPCPMCGGEASKVAVRDSPRARA